MMFSSALVAFTLVIAPGSWAQSREPLTATDDATLDGVRGEIAEVLRDPRSAYFRTVELRMFNEEPDRFVVCGLVSGENGFGGMSEPMPFYYNVGPTILAVDSTPAGQLRQQEWALYCGSQFTSLVKPLDWNE